MGVSLSIASSATIDRPHQHNPHLRHCYDQTDIEQQLASKLAAAQGGTSAVANYSAPAPGQQAGGVQSGGAYVSDIRHVLDACLHQKAG